ncbi:hypothetical protein LSPCS325_32660 [Lysinibacillus sp. CTST325]
MLLVIKIPNNNIPMTKISDPLLIIVGTFELNTLLTSTPEAPAISTYTTAQTMIVPIIPNNIPKTLIKFLCSLWTS